MKRIGLSVAFFIVGLLTTWAARLVDVLTARMNKALGSTLVIAALFLWPPSDVLADGSTPPTDEFLNHVWHAAPIVIRDCVVERVSKEDRKTIENKAKEWKGKHTPLTSEEFADFAVMYMRLSCFGDLKIDERAQPDDPWRNPASFVQALTTRRFKDYSGYEGLQALVTRYNNHQDCLFGVQAPCILNARDLNYAPVAEDGIYPHSASAPQGHSFLEAKDAGAYLQLTATTAVRSHADAVDDGLDRYKDFYLQKTTFEVVAELDGLTVLTAAPSLVFQFKEAIGNCAGLDMGQALTAVDIDSKRVAWEGKLPAGSNKVVAPHRKISARRIQFSVEGEEQISNAKMEATCELPYWSRFYTYSYDVTCPPNEGQCKVRKTLLRQHHACSSIGSCD